MSEPDSDRILVKKDSVARCAWCGTPESDDWIVTSQGESFCSPECHTAKYSLGDEESVVSGCVFSCLGGITLFFFVYAQTIGPPLDFGSAVTLLAFGVISLLLGIAILMGGDEGKNYQDRKDRYRDDSLLVCEYCTQTNPPSVTRCRYCGASLTRATLSYETTPSWTQQKRKPLGGFRCPHCNAIYSYNESNLQSDGTVRCQNCNRPFILDHRMISVDE